MTGPSDPARDPGQGEQDAVAKYEDILEHHDLTQSETPNFIDRFVGWIAEVMCWGAIVLVGVIILQVVLRYGFSAGLIVLEELQWHLYAVGVMFGLSYAQVTDSHIRVDILHAGYSERTKRWIEVFGIIFLLMPFLLIVISSGNDFVANAWRVDERSDAPLGLCCRWGIKAVIPAAFSLLALAAFSRLIHDLDKLLGTRITTIAAPLAVLGTTGYFAWLLYPHAPEILSRLGRDLFGIGA